MAASVGSLYAAYRIARACFLRLESGESKEQALEFRNEVYSRLKGFCAAKKRPRGSGSGEIPGIQVVAVLKKQKTMTDGEFQQDTTASEQEDKREVAKDIA
ncbi:unnamed protein product [Polarella glacialis]|uniref:Uncharacterized protein n=1 Tax=Polarella glacialis TaxID=89957 RepID=A0A813JQQ6_POLGL|nr:unnamed protein product [Polarella glacialis]